MSINYRCCLQALDVRLFVARQPRVDPLGQSVVFCESLSATQERPDARQREQRVKDERQERPAERRLPEEQEKAVDLQQASDERELEEDDQEAQEEHAGRLGVAC